MQKKDFIIAVCFFIAGCVCAGIYGYLRELEQAARFNDQRTQLEREHEARQRELEIRLEYAVRTVDGAREIAERTGEKLQQSAGNLKEAIAIIGEVYQQVKRLDDWLNSRDTGGSGAGLSNRLGE